MFGFDREKARKAAIQAIAPLIQELKATVSIPYGFWDDLYVLGFSEFSSRGPELSKRAAMLEEAKNRDFLRGMHAADRVESVAAGRTDYDDDATVVTARHAAANLNGLFEPKPGNPSNAEVAKLLEMLLFKDAVLDRLMPSIQDAAFVRSWPGARRSARKR